MVPIVNKEFYDKYLNAEWKRKLEANEQQRDKINKHYQQLLSATSVTTPTAEVNNEINKLCESKKGEKTVISEIANASLNTATAATTSDNVNDLAKVATKLPVKVAMEASTTDSVNDLAQVTKKLPVKVAKEASRTKQEILLNSKPVKTTGPVESGKEVYPTEPKTILDTKISAKTLPVKDEMEEKASNLEVLPDGHVKFRMKKQYSLLDGKLIPVVFKWKFMTHNKKVMLNGCKKTYKCCLGVYKCLHCDYVEAPMQPTSKKLHAHPRPCKTFCQQHEDFELSYINCTCTVDIVEETDYWNIEHHGHHSHPVPPFANRSLDVSSVKKLQQAILAAPEATPLQLKMGKQTRDSLNEIDDSLNNINRVRRERKKV